MEGLALPGVVEWKRHSSVEDTRSNTDFEIIHALGKGGFGTAYRVRNKVDSKEYAMKKVLIPSSSQQVLQRVVREAQVLSSLESTHIVRYYSAWMEKGTMDKDDDDELSHFLSADSWASTEDQQQSTSDEDATHTYVVPKERCSLCDSTYKDWEVSFEHWGLIDAVLQPLNLCVPCYLKNLPHHVDQSKIRVRDQMPLWNYLFILMELCESTLNVEIDKCMSDDDDKRWSLFRQCVEGVAYLHSKGFIHRDLKPTNIFVQQNDVVKIGDLGLATVMKSTRPMIRPDSTSMEPSDGNGSRRSSKIGTFLYTAPEVETGSYDESCDIYSLGVLLVEMFSNFTTGMERIDVLQKLKRQTDGTKILPEAWAMTHPRVTELALAMTNPNPAERWNCSQILVWMMSNKLWKHSMEKTNDRSNSMEDLVVSLSRQNDQLRSTLDAKETELSQLRKLLSQHGLSPSSAT